MLCVLQGLDGALAILRVLLVLLGPFGMQLMKCVLKVVWPLDGGCGQRAGQVHERAHEALKTWRVGAAEGQAAVCDVLQQAARGMLLVAEEPGVGHGQLHQRGLQRADELLHRPQQPGVARDVVHHQRHHFHAQGLAQPAGVFAGRDGRVAGVAMSALVAQPLHHVADLVHLLQRLERGGHGGCEVGGGRVEMGELIGAFELACKAVGKIFFGVPHR